MLLSLRQNMSGIYTCIVKRFKRFLSFCVLCTEKGTEPFIFMDVQDKYAKQQIERIKLQDAVRSAERAADSLEERLKSGKVPS
jgi:hypothetical protein